MQSDQIDLLAAALVKAQAAMKPASMNKTNPHFRSKYADLASIIESLRKPLSDNGLSFTQTTHLGAIEYSMYLVTTLLHTSGQWLRAEYQLPTNATPQQMGSALTYARRYSLSAITGTAADEDDDGDKAEVQVKKIPTAEPTYGDGKRIVPQKIPMPDKPRHSDWVEFGQGLIAGVNGAANDTEAKAWKDINRETLDKMIEKNFPFPELTQRLDLALQKIGPKHAP